MNYTRTWNTETFVPAPHPPPEVPARPASASEVPRALQRWHQRAVDSGWMARMTYARGTTIDRNGRPGRVVHSVALRARAHTALVVVVYHAYAYDPSSARFIEPADARWTVDCAYAWSIGEFPLPIALTASKADPDRETLGAYLTNPGPRRKWAALSLGESVEAGKE